jgi:hypothetical protein
MGGVVVTEFHSRRWAVAAAVILLAPALSACSSATSSFSSLFGSKTAAGETNASAISQPPPNFECPDVSVRQGASTLTASGDAADASATNLRYQVTIGTTARECKYNAGIVSIKVGMQGRVILGPQGTPGPVDVPVRYAVVQEGIDPQTITTKLDHVSVTVPPDDTNMLFSHVTEGLEFPMPKGSAIDSYVIYIGFDPVGAREIERKKPAPKPAKPAKPLRNRQSG